VPRVGFEPTTLVFERAKTIHALDLAATAIDSMRISIYYEHMQNLNKSQKVVKERGLRKWTPNFGEERFLIFG
jgi:hypothetical protein